MTLSARRHVHVEEGEGRREGGRRSFGGTLVERCIGKRVKETEPGIPSWGFVETPTILNPEFMGQFGYRFPPRKSTGIGSGIPRGPDSSCRRRRAPPALPCPALPSPLPSPLRRHPTTTASSHGYVQPRIGEEGGEGRGRNDAKIHTHVRARARSEGRWWVLRRRTRRKPDGEDNQRASARTHLFAREDWCRRSTSPCLHAALCAYPPPS